MLLALDDSVKLPPPKENMDGVYLAAVALVEALEMAKPNNRSKQDRAVAVALTDAQKLVAWIKTYCME